MQGLKRLQDFDFVAIFDADFKPDSDFLVSTHATYAFTLTDKDSASRSDALSHCIVGLSVLAGSIVPAQASLCSMLLRLAFVHADEDHTPFDA